MSSKKFREKFLLVWKDPVWSKVIAAGILALIAVVWAKITNHTWAEIYDFVFDFLSFKLPIFFFLSAIGLFFIFKLFWKTFGRRRDPIWDEKIGNYTYKELYNIFLTETYAVSTVGMQMSGMSAPSDNLIILFRTYYPFLNKGVDFDSRIQDGGYLYSVLAPKLVGYGLVEAYQKPLYDLPDRSEVAYRTTELGHKFHAFLEKIILPQKLREFKRNTSR